MKEQEKYSIVNKEGKNSKPGVFFLFKPHEDEDKVIKLGAFYYDWRGEIKAFERSELKPLGVIVNKNA